MSVSQKPLHFDQGRHASILDGISSGIAMSQKHGFGCLLGILVLLIWLAPVTSVAQAPSGSLRKVGSQLAERILTDPIEKLNYRYGLALEAALDFAEATQDDPLHHRVLARVKPLANPDAGIPWQREPFGCLTHAMFRATNDKAWLTGFIKESVAMKLDVWRSESGVLLHPRGSSRGGGHAMLIDAMQEYSARLARAAAASDDPKQRDDLRADAVFQWAEYRKQLRYPDTGLWSQGKGWLTGKPEELSPGAWSRGHGWLLRGLMATLEALPPDTKEAPVVLSIFRELCESLLPLQQADGSWHTLLHRAPNESPIDISGTSMIATAYSQGWRHGWLKDRKYLVAAKRSFAILPTFVNGAGQVISVSPGPGPLQSEDDYLAESFPIDNDHGVFSVLFAAAEAQRLKEASDD